MSWPQNETFILYPHSPTWWWKVRWSLWSFTVKQRCSILQHNWSRWGPSYIFSVFSCVTPPWTLTLHLFYIIYLYLTVHFVDLFCTYVTSFECLVCPGRGIPPLWHLPTSFHRQRCWKDIFWHHYQSPWISSEAEQNILVTGALSMDRCYRGN